MSGTAIESTRPRQAKLTKLQNVRKAACPRLGIIIPSNLHASSKRFLNKLALS
jgi:hypothetical protein